MHICSDTEGDLASIVQSLEWSYYPWDSCMVYSIYLLYMYHKHQPNVGKYASPMDPMGNDPLEYGNLKVPGTVLFESLIFRNPTSGVRVVWDWEIHLL